MWVAEINDWCTWLRAAGRSPETIRTRRQHMRTLAPSFLEGPGSVQQDSLLAWAGSRRWAAETRHAYYVSFRQFFRWRTTVYDCASPAEALPMIHRIEPPARPIPENVLLEGLARAPERTQLILLLAAEAGLRSGEIAQIHEDDLTMDLMGYSLMVHGKGNRPRVVPLSPGLHGRMCARLAVDAPWLFPGKINGHISARWVGKLGASVLPEPWTLHTLRHRFATRAYDGDKDIYAVKQLLGHANISTTQRYIASDTSALRHAASAAEIHT